MHLSAFTTDLTANPDLLEAMKHEAAKHGRVTVTEHGKVTTVSAETL